ncbi:hypothetical protein PACTADRAFT_28604, partial [Pachysolen tannophilus NRRL Y-2460]
DVAPDGGYGWVCVLCVSLFTFCTWGINSSYGVFLRFYLESDYFPNATSIDFALIGSIVVGISQIIAPFVFWFTQCLGFRQALIIGVIIQTAGYVLASFSTKIWQLYLTQGLMIAISFSFLFCPTSAIISSWFVKKRSLATGLSVTGAGFGGLIFSLSISKMIEDSGNQKSGLRLLAIVSFVICSLCIVFAKPRNYKRQKLNVENMVKSFKIIFDMSAWKEFNTLMVSLYFGIANMGYTVVLFSLSSYSQQIGLSANDANYLTALLNVGQILGRPLIGFLADKFGRVNFSIIGTNLMVILIFAFWINAKTYASLIALALIMGFAMPIASVMNQPLTADGVEPSRFISAYSLVLLSVGAFALPSEVIGLVLRTQSDKDFPYLHCQIFSGLGYFVGGLFLLPLREFKIKKILIQRKKKSLADLRETDNSSAFPFEEDKDEKIRKRILKYEYLLQNNIKCYFLRMFYPI